MSMSSRLPETMLTIYSLSRVPSGKDEQLTGLIDQLSPHEADRLGLLVYRLDEAMAASDSSLMFKTVTWSAHGLGLLKKIMDTMGYCSRYTGGCYELEVWWDVSISG